MPGPRHRAVRAARARRTLACCCLCIAWPLALGAPVAGAHDRRGHPRALNAGAHDRRTHPRALSAGAPPAYVGEYSGQYSFQFHQEGQQPGRVYDDEADEELSWDAHFAAASASRPATAKVSVSGSDRFVRAGGVEDPETSACTIASRHASTLAPQYFQLEAGAAPGTVDVRAVIPIFTGTAGLVTVGPSANSVCSGLQDTGAAVNCDPFGCAWECVAFAAEPAFDGAWLIDLEGVPLSSFPRTFQSAESMSPCSEPTVSYSAQRSLSATLSVVASAPPGRVAAKRARKAPSRHG